MEKETSFLCSKLNEDIKEATIQYFVSQGFRLAESSERFLSFKRGSFLLNMVTMNPLKWKSIINVEIGDEVVKAVFDIDTTSQLASVKEEELWDNFITNYREAIIEDFNYVEANNKLLRSTLSGTRKFIGAAVVGAVAAWIPAAVIAHYTGIGSIGGIGATAGALGYLSYIIEKERKRDVV
ncbi:hypothetical protein [Pontibacter rugosus]|uniref:Uncharacterized protein n=1 Tax=Pontibacter rugosus TaxID=1745966 RepID=A0ABW3SVA9_9BACT